MRILYDGQIYKYQVAGGISRYFASLISRLPQSFVPHLTTPSNRGLIHPSHANLKIWRYRSFLPFSIAHKLEKYYFRAAHAFNQFDILHPTYYSLLTQQEFSQGRQPIVLTVYDMIHELFREQIDPSGEHAAQKYKAIAAAQKIICISENTKKDLIELYSVPEAKISVTHLASEMDESLSWGPEEVPLRPYYLYVGSRDASYKNFDGLLLAFSKLISVYPEVILCVVGAPLNPEEAELISTLGLADHIKHYGHIDNNHLAKLYRCSVAFVYPSLYEGFGIPPLEAMSCGTVVIASNCASLPEVMGDAGLPFNPKSVTDLADNLLFLLTHPAERERLIAKGYQRVQLFSWQKTVAQTLEVYASVRP